MDNDINIQQEEPLNNVGEDNKENPAPKEKSAKKNYLYNLIYQVFSLIVPLVVTPYVSRVLGSSGIGQYAFSYSLISYFMLVGAFGFGYYAQREIARYQNDKHKQSIIFWEIILCRSVTVILALVVNLILITTGVYGDYSQLMAIFMINIVSTALDVAFLFQGNEEFGTIAIVSIVVKALGVVGIFVFVKNENDVWIYTLMNCLILIVSQLCLWVLLPKMLKRVHVKNLKVFRHFIPSLRLFIPTIAVSIYTMLDRTLIGVLVEGETIKQLADGTIVVLKNADIQNGYYEQSEKLVKMALTVLTSLGTVMVPKNAYFIKIGDNKRVISNIYKAIRFVFILGIPIMFGLMATARNFSPWFFGPGYEAVPDIIMIFSPLILAIGLNNIFGIQYLLPAGKDSVYAFSVLFGAVVNLVLNIIFIRIYGAMGAAVASVIAETLILVFQMIYLRKLFNYKSLILPFIKYLVIGGIMFAGVFLLGEFVFASSILNSFIMVTIGIVIYLLLLLLVKDPILFSFIHKVKNRFSRRGNQNESK